MSYPQEVLAGARKRDAHEAEFLQALEEVLTAVAPCWNVLPSIAKPAFSNAWSNPNG